MHTEVASSLDTDSCINAICRFIARRGEGMECCSDNGTNFVEAERELKTALSEINHAKIQSHLHQQGMKWTFNPPAGSHPG